MKISRMSGTTWKRNNVLKTAVTEGVRPTAICRGFAARVPPLNSSDKTGMIRKFIILIYILCLVLLGPWADVADPVRDTENGPISVYHAGGTVCGIGTTNSLEAIDESYRKGYDYIEIDFLWTTDKELVCMHDWGSRYSPSITEGAAVSHEAFMDIEIFGKYTPLDLPALVLWLETHPKITVITDIKEDNIAGLELISSKYPGMINRFIPQIYAYDEYGAVSELGFQRIILTLYKMSWNDKTDTDAIVKFASSHVLWNITIAKEIATGKYVGELKKSGVSVMVHTVNDEADINKYMDMGCAGVYRDY